MKNSVRRLLYERLIEPFVELGQNVIRRIQVALEGEQDQVRVTFQVERLHDVVLVKHNRLLADFEIRD
jgi:hypothetical protein